MALSSPQRREVHESLDEFGLSHAEQLAYIALLERGETTATPLARELDIPLTTAQSLLGRLAEMGLVHVTKRKSRSAYEAKDPSVFKTLLEQKLRDMSGIIPLLQTLRAEEQTPAKIRVYHRERMTDIFREALGTKKKLVYEIVSAREIQEALGEKFHFTKRRLEKGIRLKSLRVEANEIKKYNAKIHERELREAKFLPRELTFHCSIMFWDTTAAFFTPVSEGLAWVVESPATVEMLRQLFEVLWSVSRRMDTIETDQKL